MVAKKKFETVSGRRKHNYVALGVYVPNVGWIGDEIYDDGSVERYWHSSTFYPIHHKPFDQCWHRV